MGLCALAACANAPSSGNSSSASASSSSSSGHVHPSSSAATSSSGGVGNSSGSTSRPPDVWRCPGALQASSLPYVSPEYATVDLFDAPLTTSDTAPYGYLFPRGRILRVHLDVVESGAYRVGAVFNANGAPPSQTPWVWPLSSCQGGVPALLAPPFQSQGAIQLQAGQSVDFVVHLPAPSLYPQRVAVHVGAPCASSCGTAACGEDSCGLSCGTCRGPDVCDTATSACVDVEGQDCGDAIVVDPNALPYVHRQLARLFRNDRLAACNGALAQRDLVYAFTPNVTGVYLLEATAVAGPSFPADYVTPDVVVTRDCQDACASLTPGTNHRFVLEAGVAYSMVVRLFEAGPVGDQQVELRVAPPCIQQCSGRACGDDGCGATCGTCNATAQEECDEGAGACLPVANLCTLDLAGPCNLPGHVCDPAGCAGSCEPLCFLRVCEQQGASHAWVSRELYAPSSCALAGCPNLPLALPFDYASDFTSARVVIPLDPVTGQCLPVGTPALVMGFNQQHSRYINSVAPWRILQASSGDLFDSGGFDTLLDFLDGPQVLRVRSPGGVRFDVEFAWGANVILRAIRPVP